MLDENIATRRENNLLFFVSPSPERTIVIFGANLK